MRDTRGPDGVWLVGPEWQSLVGRQCDTMGGGDWGGANKHQNFRLVALCDDSLMGEGVTLRCVGPCLKQRDPGVQDALTLSCLSLAAKAGP